MVTHTVNPGYIHRAGAVWQRACSDPAYGGFALLRFGFALIPLWMGADKFFNAMTYWPGYLAPWIVGLLPFSAQTALHVVGGIEIAAGCAVAIKPRYAGYVVTLWLAGTIINLLTYSGFYDVALRDFGLLVGALTLARLASVYDPSLCHRAGQRTASLGEEVR